MFSLSQTRPRQPPTPHNYFEIQEAHKWPIHSRHLIEDSLSFPFLAIVLRGIEGNFFFDEWNVCLAILAFPFFYGYT
jgi:hypothetical protein